MTKQSDSMKEVILNRTDNSPLTFTGHLIGRADSSPDSASSDYSGSTGRWEECFLFQTAGGQYICYRCSCSQWRGEQTIEEAHVAANPAEVAAFFGWGRLAKSLYADAGLNLTTLAERVS